MRRDSTKEDSDETEVREMTTKKYSFFSYVGFIGAAISIAMGFYKMFVYENPNSDDYPSLYNDSVNSYVGGDAYNYIINGTYTTSYFVLALVFTVFACSMLISKKLSQ